MRTAPSRLENLRITSNLVFIFKSTRRRRLSQILTHTSKLKMIKLVRGIKIEIFAINKLFLDIELSMQLMKETESDELKNDV